MASLTGQLQTEMRGKSVIDGNKAAPSFLGGLLNVAQGAIAGLGPLEARAEAREAKNAANAAEQARFDYLSAREQQLDPAFKQAGDELQRAKTAEEQGRAPPGSTDLRAEKVVSELYSRFPDQKANIAQYLQGRGFDHYMFKAVQQEEKWQALEDDLERTQFKTYTEAAIRHGVANDDPVATAATGAKILQEEAKIAAAQKAAEVARAKRQLSLDERKFALEQAEKQSIDAIINIAEQKAGSVVPVLSSLLSGASGDEDKTGKVQSIAPQVTFAFETYRANAHAQLARQGASEDAHKSLDARLDAIKGNIDTLFNANVTTNTRAYNTMKVQMAMNDAEALPIYNRLSRLLGQNAVNQYFGGDPTTALSPDVISALSKELKGYKTESAAKAAVSINNASQLLKGQRGLGDMSEEEAREAFKFVPGAVKGGEQAILKGDLSSIPEYTQALSVSLNAAVEIQPGSPDMNAIYNAVQTVASVGTMKALTAIKKNDSAGSDPLVFAARGTAGHLFRTAQQSGPNQVGSWKLAFNPKTGDYRLTQDRAMAEREARAASAPTVIGPGGLEAAHSRQAPVVINTSPPSSLLKKQKALNESLTFLVGTSPLDAEMPKGLTPMQLREYYASGKPVVKKTGTGPNAKADPQWDKAFESFKTELQTFATSSGMDGGLGEVSRNPFKGELGDKISSLATKYGVPEGIAHAWIRQESGGNPTARSSAGAFGLAQLMPGTAKDLGVDINDPDQNLEGGFRYLSQQFKKYGNWREALAAYNAGPGNVDKYGGIPPFEETQTYVRRILGG